MRDADRWLAGWHNKELHRERRNSSQRWKKIASAALYPKADVNFSELGHLPM